MKYLKRINEIFDSEELKDQFEIPYLKGDLDPSKVLKWEKVKDDSDNKLLNSIVRACPFVADLSYRKGTNSLELGFKDTIHGDNQVFYYFLIEIIDYSNFYNMNMYATSIVNGRKTYNESLIKGRLSFIDLCDILNDKVFKELVDFNNYLEDNFDRSHFFIKNKKNIVFNPNLN